MLFLQNVIPYLKKVSVKKFRAGSVYVDYDIETDEPLDTEVLHAAMQGGVMNGEFSQLHVAQDFDPVIEGWFYILLMTYGWLINRFVFTKSRQLA